MVDAREVVQRGQRSHVLVAQQLAPLRQGPGQQVIGRLPLAQAGQYDAEPVARIDQSEVVLREPCFEQLDGAARWAATSGSSHTALNSRLMRAWSVAAGSIAGASAWFSRRRHRPAARRSRPVQNEVRGRDARCRHPSQIGMHLPQEIGECRMVASLPGVEQGSDRAHRATEGQFA